MKLLKKLAAVVVAAAICCTMTAPMTVSASVEESCLHPYTRLTQKRSYLYTTDHYYDRVMDVNGDGRPENVSGSCTYSAYDVWDVHICLECGAKAYEQYAYEEYHQISLCEYYGGYYRPQ